MYIQGRIRMIMCGADFYVADVKEELSYLNGIFVVFVWFISTWRMPKEELSYLDGNFFCFCVVYFYVSGVKGSFRASIGKFSFVFLVRCRCLHVALVKADSTLATH